ncbi:hypothetical protein D3C87_1790770 [compost metagenome]
MLEGANRPNHVAASKFFIPASVIVGTWAMASTRRGCARAIALSLPDWMCGNAADRVTKAICTWPPIRSVIMGASPRYGT